jgi:hypothetical protein
MSSPNHLFERILATQDDPDDHEVYLAYFRFPDRATMTRCLAPLGLDDLRSMRPSAFRRPGMAIHVSGLDFMLRLAPEGGMRELGPNDAERANEIAQALAGLEIVKYRLPFPRQPPPPG